MSARSGRFFLDTNIFVYTFDHNAAEKAVLAHKLVKRALESRRGVISFQVIQEFFNFALKRAKIPMTWNDAEDYLKDILSPLLDVNSSVVLYRSALTLQSRFQLSWYDSLIVAAAQQSRCSTLYSEALQHGQKIGDLVIENPFR